VLGRQTAAVTWGLNPRVKRPISAPGTERLLCTLLAASILSLKEGKAVLLCEVRVSLVSLLVVSSSG
jgi:hypothetical protein